MEIEKGIQDNVIRSLAEFIAAPSFQRSFEQFFLDHALTFTDDKEHRLDYMEIYLRFQDMFNKRMEAFLASVNISEDEFVERCQKVIKSDPKAEQYLEIVVASMDYDAFYNLMKAMRSRASLDHIKVDAKARGSGDDDDDDGDVDLDGDAKSRGTRTSDSARADSTERLRGVDEASSERKDSDKVEDLVVTKLELRDDEHVEEKGAKSSTGSKLK